MEKYIDRSSIVSLETYEKELMCEFYRVRKKPWKLFGLIPISKEKFLIQSQQKYNSGRCAYNSIEQAFRCEYGIYPHKYVLENYRVYRRPFVMMTDKSGRQYFKYFDTEKEVDDYIQSLDLDIVKKYIKLKID